jgi:hypothetical protein
MIDRKKYLLPFNKTELSNIVDFGRVSLCGHQVCVLFRENNYIKGFILEDGVWIKDCSTFNQAKREMDRKLIEYGYILILENKVERYKLLL